ncbi:MAG: hypothetical protein R2877_04570 [Bdellovibrionota bacterium]
MKVEVQKLEILFGVDIPENFHHSDTDRDSLDHEVWSILSVDMQQNGVIGCDLGIHGMLKGVGNQANFGEEFSTFNINHILRVGCVISISPSSKNIESVCRCMIFKYKITIFSNFLGKSLR